MSDIYERSCTSVEGSLPKNKVRNLKSWTTGIVLHFNNLRLKRLPVLFKNHMLKPYRINLSDLNEAVRIN